MARSDPQGPFIKLSSPETEEFWKIPILHEDEDLFAIDKPALLLTSPDRYDPNRPNIMKLLHRDLEKGAPWVEEHALTYLANAHRLDFETSGVLLLAKNKPALVHLANQFGEAKPNKQYLAIVKGNPPENKLTTEAKLSPHPVKLGMMKVDPKRGKKSKTQVEVLERFRGFALVRCTPWTGRTHQIRVHLKHLGFPILSDWVYGGPGLYLSQIKRGYEPKKDAKEQPLIGRVALHASLLTVTHPTKGTAVTIESPMPKDFQVALKYLRKFAVV